MTFFVINVAFAPDYPFIRLFVKYKIVNRTIFAASSLSDKQCITHIVYAQLCDKNALYQ